MNISKIKKMLDEYEWLDEQLNIHCYAKRKMKMYDKIQIITKKAVADDNKEVLDLINSSAFNVEWFNPDWSNQ